MNTRKGVYEPRTDQTNKLKIKSKLGELNCRGGCDAVGIAVLAEVTCMIYRYINQSIRGYEVWNSIKSIKPNIKMYRCLALYFGIREKDRFDRQMAITPTSSPSYHREASISGSPNVASRPRPSLHLPRGHELSSDGTRSARVPTQSTRCDGASW